MSHYSQTKLALARHGLAPKKRFGQNFLVHKHTAEAIVRAGELDAKDTVLEVGVGLAALTLPLADTVKKVIGLEVDSGIIRFHQAEDDLPENVTLLHQDVLKADFKELVRLSNAKLKIMANLPYSISNPFIFKLIENKEDVEWATIMLQKEVADRLMAAPGTKQYGIPSLLLQSTATIRRLMTLKPSEFHPRPKVDSVVVKISFAGQAPHLRDLPEYDWNLFQSLVRTGFSKRRKTLLNNLSSGQFFWKTPGQGKAEIKSLTKICIENAKLSPTERAENLSLKEFVQLTLSFQKEKDLRKK